MLCPKCKKDMIAIERNNIELDYCIFCNGFWFDDGEWNILSKILISKNITSEFFDVYSLPKINTKEDVRKCPICNCEMEKFSIYNVLLDRCKKRHGIWFDKNEFSKCVNALSSNNNTKTPISFLGEIFYTK